MVRIKRAYDEAERSDGTRVLVDRLWPRGLRKDAVDLDDWLREIAPSDDLRRWYGHDPARFDEFADRYRVELTDAPHTEALTRLREYARGGPLTLLTSTRDLAHAHTAVLAELVDGGQES